MTSAKASNRKHTILSALIISGILSVIVFAAEGISAFISGSMPLAFPSYGGECTVSCGIGWNIQQIYPLSLQGEPLPAPQITFSPNIILFFILTFFAVILIKMAANRKKRPAA